MTPDYDWWIQSAHEDSALLLLMRDERAFDRQISDRYLLVWPDATVAAVQGAVNQAKWRALYEPERFGGMSSILAEIRQPAAPATPTPVDPLPSVVNGMQIDESAFRTAFNFARPFWAPGRFFTGDDDEFETLLDGWLAVGNVAMASAIWGPSNDGYSFRSNALQHRDVARRRMDRAAARGLALILFLSDNHLIERFGWNWQQFYDTARDVAATFGPHIRWMIGPWEGAEVMSGRYNRERRLMMEALNSGLHDAQVPHVRLGRHERAMEGVFVEDLQGHNRPVASLIQTGFGATEREIREFITEDAARMRHWGRQGRFAPHDHLYVAAEHSIPDISPRWQPSQTWAEAVHRGWVCLSSGADLDFSGGQVR